VRSHLVALMRLVEICVDGGLESTMYEAQAALADGYLDQGRAMEARIISEDLVAREPWNRVNIDRFRRALVMLGESDPDGIIAERLSGESPFLATEKMDLNEGVTFDTPREEEPVAPPAAPTKETKKGKSKASPAPVEVDLTDMLNDPAGSAGQAPAARSLDQVFRGMRDDSTRESSEEAAAEQYRLALTYHEMGMPEDAITALEAAARSPRQRFRRGVDARPLVSRTKRHRPRDRVARTRRRSARTDA
jgi:hypothetical protein